MKNNISPINKTTECSDDGRAWLPASLTELFDEIAHIKAYCGCPLFRGQLDAEWPLDSPFVRYFIPEFFGIEGYTLFPSHIRRNLNLHRLISSSLLMKYGGVIKPSQEALKAEVDNGIDPWFELMKHEQQYPERYNELPESLKGTFYIDWSTNQEVPLYFATYDGKGEARTIGEQDGALWIFDAGATGAIQQKEKMVQILELMQTPDFLEGRKTLPLMFHPEKQTTQLRAENQDPVYIAQMDYRGDLADACTGYEEHEQTTVFKKLIIKKELKQGLAELLENQGITEEHVYPH